MNEFKLTLCLLLSASVLCRAASQDSGTWIRVDRGIREASCFRGLRWSANAHGNYWQRSFHDPTRREYRTRDSERQRESSNPRGRRQRCRPDPEVEKASSSQASHKVMDRSFVRPSSLLFQPTAINDCEYCARLPRAASILSSG